MKISREDYGALYGPTTGDRVRLADTDLWLEVEEDRCFGGDEAVFGGGKTIRESMAQGGTTRAQGAPDLVITNVIVLDHCGIVRCDVGIRDGRIVALGKAGNPDISDGIDPALRIGATTDVIAGEGRILTAGGIDGHVHFICPRVVDQAVSAGVTTLIGGGNGPTEGTRATTCTPSPRAMHEMLIALDTMPVNVLLLGKGNTMSREGMLEQLRAGAGGMKLHEDWGATPAAIDACLRVAEETGRAGRPAQRHAQRGGLPAVDGQGDRRPVDPCLPHRGRRRGPCARHHRAGLLRERAAVVDEPDAAVHGQHDRRAPRHAHGLPSPQSEDRGGPRVRDESDPAVDDRRRGHPAGPRRDLDGLLGRAGDGPRRRDDHPHVADGARHARGGASRRRDRAPTTTACAATWRSTRSARRSRTASTTRSARSRSASSPTSSCGTRRSSPSARAWSSRAARSRGRRSATRTPRSRPRSRSSPRRCSRAPGDLRRAARWRSSRPLPRPRATSRSSGSRRRSSR